MLQKFSLNGIQIHKASVLLPSPRAKKQDPLINDKKEEISLIK